MVNQINSLQGELAIILIATAGIIRDISMYTSNIAKKRYTNKWG